jgi:hypothetical protein
MGTGNPTNTNPSRGAVQHNHPRTIQHGKPSQQQTQTQVKQQAPPKQEKRVSDHGGFDGLLVGQRCRFKTGMGDIIEGIISAASKYWYLVNVDGQIVIVNKAYVVSIMPIQKPNENNQQNTSNTVGEVSGNGRGQPLGT